MRYLIVDGHSVIFAWPELRKLHNRRTEIAPERARQNPHGRNTRTPVRGARRRGLRRKKAASPTKRPNPAASRFSIPPRGRQPTPLSSASWPNTPASTKSPSPRPITWSSKRPRPSATRLVGLPRRAFATIWTTPGRTSPAGSNNTGGSNPVSTFKLRAEVKSACPDQTR